MRVKLSQIILKELTQLLALDDKDLLRHRAGKLIRDNFRLRGWLKCKERGNPVKGYRVMKAKLEGVSDYD